MALGPCELRLLDFGNTSQQILWAGKNVVEIELGKVKARTVIEAWLHHLQVCACGQSLLATVIIARNETKLKKHNFDVALRFDPLSIEEAKQLLDQLRLIASQGLEQCWPVPPDSGWAFARANYKDPKNGEKAFNQKWKGGFNIKGERDKAEMQLCFGVRCEASTFLSNEVFQEACMTIYGPLLKTISKT